MLFYIFQFHKILKGKKKRRERERERERISVKKNIKLALVFSAYDLILLTRMSKLNILFQRHLGFLKSMFREI